MVYIHVGFHRYASILYMFRKTYFDVSSSWFQILFLSKLILGFISKIMIYHLQCLLDSIHTLYTSNVFKYHAFVFIQVLEKTNFHFKILSFEKYNFYLKLNFHSSK